LGEAIAPDSLVSLSPPQPKSVPGGWQGSIQYVDHFGNLITNIPGDRVPNNLEQGRSQSWRVQIGDTQIPGRQAYGAAEPGELLALVGSHGWVEIAQNQGSGAIALGLTYGDHVQVLTAP
ncbi:MAG: SAM hydroxide adenosyltransferase, partial [Cyanobacteria bacterium P01_D01_bin.73]